MDMLRQATPALFDEYPVDPRRILSWRDHDITHYKETMQLLEATKVEIFENFGARP